MPTTREAEDFERLVVTQRPKLSRVLRRYQIPPEDAEDLVQETFLILWQKFDEVRHPEGWLLVTLRNRCIMYWRARRRSRTVGLPADFDQLSQLVHVEPDDVSTRRDLDRAFSRLPPRLASLLWLRRVVGSTRAQAADVTGYSVKSQKEAVDQAERRLHGLLESECR